MLVLIIARRGALRPLEDIGTASIKRAVFAAEDR